MVRDVVVEGAQRIEPETIRSYLLIQPGDPFNPARIDRSLKSLFATGLFADVALKRQGDTLLVSVVENPVINRIAFEGNRKLDDETLETEVTLRPRIIYTRTKVQQDVQRILTLYRRSGRFAATVDPKVIQLPQNRVDLVFEISEGDPTEVRNIRFIGNREFSDSRLREEVRTKESRWYRFLSGDDTYDPDRLTLDRELLRRYYLRNGFADFRVISALAELTPDRKDFFITFTVEEGVRYQIGKVDVDILLRDLEKEPLLDEIEIEPEDWYDFEEVDKTLERLTDVVGNMGHAFVDIRPRVSRDREARTIDVVFEVAEGPRVFVERIDINGNVRTTDKVIRREFKLVEGDAFNSAKMRRSRQRVQNLDFFQKVEVDRQPGSAPDKTVISVEVEEKSTGSLSLGAGFSTTNGPMADIGLKERNLLGKGYNLRVGALIAAKQSQVDMSFTDPYFLDREMSGGFDLFHTTKDLQDSSSYDIKKTGGGLRVGYPITEDLRQSWNYTFQLTDVTNVDDSASSYVKSQEGKNSLSQISHILSYDKRDSRMSPTDGYIVRMVNDVAGLGGTSRFMRNRVNGTHYTPIADDWVLSLSASVGHIFGIGKDVSLTDRFFVGGDDLRGFATAGIGPRDTSTEDALGGEWMYTASAEVKFPLGLPDELGISGRVFTDAGSSGKVEPGGAGIKDSGALRASIGTGVTRMSPVGPIGIDLALPVLKEDTDVEENFRLNFGTRF